MVVELFINIFIKENSYHVFMTRIEQRDDARDCVRGILFIWEFL